MPNDEIRMPKELPNPKPEEPAWRSKIRLFEIRVSSFIRRSSFVIRHLTASSKTPSLVAAEVTRLKFLQGEKKKSEPPHVGCYFFDRLSAGPARLSTMLVVVLLLSVSTFVKAAAKESPGNLLRLEFQLPSSAEKESEPILHLRGKDARQQLLVTAKFDNAALRDFTRQVSYSVSPPDIVKIDRNGRVTPLGDGAATITAKGPDGLSAVLPVHVEHFDEVAPINFPNQIVPIFTKAGCNAGGCHGKSSGQNGFRLSLLGFEPAEDYEHLVKEERGRRIFTSSPENSLLPLKASAT